MIYNRDLRIRMSENLKMEIAGAASLHGFKTSSSYARYVLQHVKLVPPVVNLPKKKEVKKWSKKWKYQNTKNQTGYEYFEDY